MNRRERIENVLNGKPVDRTPVSMWMHFSEHDQDPRSLAEAQVAFNEKFDFDFIKLMPFGAYSTQDFGAKIKIYADKYEEPVVVTPAIETVEDYKKIRPLEATHGTHGKTLQLAQHVAEMVSEDTPFIQTIFSPMTTLKKMGPESLFDDLKNHPDAVHQALKALTETTINFVEANIEAGVDGFFLATQTASYDLMDEATYKEFCEPYDLEVIDAYKDNTWFNMLHIHGKNIMFDIANTYPVNSINWHDRYTAPNLNEARSQTDKALVGGLYEFPLIQGDGSLAYETFLGEHSVEEIEKYVHEAIKMADNQNLIIGPGCVVDPKVSDEKIQAVRNAVETYQ